MIEDTLPTAISLVLGATDDAGRLEGEDDTADLDVLSCLLKHGAWPTPRHLTLVIDDTGFEPSRKCFLDAICFATNPLLVGMTLSLQLADAAGLGNEGHRRVSCFDSTVDGGVVGPRQNLGYKGVFGEHPDFCLTGRRSARTITMCRLSHFEVPSRGCVAEFGTLARLGLGPRFRFPLNVLGWASSPTQVRCVFTTYVYMTGICPGIFVSVITSYFRFRALSHLNSVPPESAYSEQSGATSARVTTFEIDQPGGIPPSEGSRRPGARDIRAPAANCGWLRGGRSYS